MSGLAAGLSASEDRDLLTQLNVEADFASAPSFETTAEGCFAPSDAAATLEAMHSFASNLLGFDDALDPTEDGIDESFLDTDNVIFKAVQASQGTPWPTPWTEPDDWGVSTTQGFDVPRATMSGLGGGIFLESLNGLSVAPASSVDKNQRKEQFRVLLTAGMQPGTKLNREVTKKLLEKNLELAKLAEQRGLVTKRARDKFQTNLAQVTRNDREVQRLYNLVFDAAGKIKPTATDAQLQSLLRLRKSNIELGRDTVRLQKLNMLASAITSNTLTQLTAVQNMAQAVATGAPEALPALGLAYDKLGRENAKIREAREKQRENWTEKQDIKSARDGAGLEGFDGLYGLDVIERPFDEMENQLAALEFSFKKAARKFKKGAKKAGKTVKKTVKKTAKGTKRVAKSAEKKIGSSVRKASSHVKAISKEVGKAGSSLVKATVVAPAQGTIAAAKAISKGDIKGAFKAVGASVVDQAKHIKDVAARTALKWGCDVANTKAFKTGVRAVGQAVGTTVGGVMGSPTIGGAVGNEAGNQAVNMQRNTCGAMKTVGLTDGTFRPGRIDNAAKDFAKRAWKETLSPKAQLAALKRVATNAIGGQLTAGFNVGGVDVMKKVGLDPDKLVSNNPIVQDLYKQGTRKLQNKMQKQFTESTGSLLKKTGIPGVDRLTPAIQSAMQSGKMPDVDLNKLAKKGKSALRKQGTNLLTKEGNKLLKKTGIPGVDRLTPAIQSAMQSGKMPNVDLNRLTKKGKAALKKQGNDLLKKQIAALKRMPNASVRSITAQGAQLLKQQATAISKRPAGAAITRTVPITTQQFVSAASAGLAPSNMRSPAAMLALARKQLAPATVDRAQTPPHQVSRFISQTTAAALPYVGSLGRDF